jgi:hypothetical protein
MGLDEQRNGLVSAPYIMYGYSAYMAEMVWPDSLGKIRLMVEAWVN